MPSASLVKRYAHLDDTHKALKADYEKLRVKYSEDLKHWKEWRVVEVARAELKRKKKEARRALRAMSPGSSAKASDSLRAELVISSGESHPIDEARSGTQREKPGTSATSEGLYGEEDEHDFEGDEDMMITFIPALSSAEADPIFRSPERAPLPSKCIPEEPGTIATDWAGNTSTNGAIPSKDKARIQGTSRVTPWLGHPVAPPKKSGRASKHTNIHDSFEETDDFTKTPASNVTPAAKKTPLVRDRLGDLSSLRKTTLRRTVGGVSGNVAPGKSASPTPLSADGQTKRKLDLENMSPAEKSVRLKELSKMPASEKREIYARFKGKGRYLPPEDVWVYHNLR